MSDRTEANWMWDLFRGIGRFLDNIVYWLLGLMYEIFFNVASAELFTNETVKNFYGRVQLILGVFMIFKLAVSIVKGIVNPDTFTDKNNGMNNIIMRIIFSLVMLTLIVPINIPNARNEYEIQLNNNGLLFGTLYSLQNRILSNNTLGRLILGTTDTLSTDPDSSNTNSKLKQSANLFTATILKGFIRINVVDETTPETSKSNWVCEKDIDTDHMSIYTDLTASPDELLALTTLKCDSPDASGWQKFWNSNQSYAFAYKYIISAIVGGIFIYILVNFTIDIAVRAIKLAILRLIAPIPIISYIDPSGQKKMFDSWVKNLTSTYLDLFIRLAIIYFVIFLIQDIIVNGLVINQATGAVGIFTYIFIFLGLFVFAKQAPKFIKQLFGMKDDGGKLFGGLGEALGIAGGVGAAAIGSIGAFGAGMRASKMSDETRMANGETDIFGNKVNPNSFLNRGKHLMAGIAGGVGGFGTGMKTAFTAKEHAARSTFEAMQKRNAAAIAAGDAGSTLAGRMTAMGARAFTGEAQGAQIAREIKSRDARKTALEQVKKRMGSEMVKSTITSGKLGLKDAAGNDITANYKSFMAAYNAAKTAGASDVTFTNTATGANETISMRDAEMQYGYLQKTNEENYLSQVLAGTIDDKYLTSYIAEAETLGGGMSATIDPTTGEVTSVSDIKKIRTRSDVNDSIDNISLYNTQVKRKNATKEANDHFAGGKK